MVLGYAALVARHKGDALGRIHRAASTKSDDDIGMLRYGQFRTFLHRGGQRIGSDLIEQYGTHAFTLKQCTYPVVGSSAFDRAASGDDHRSGAMCGGDLADLFDLGLGPKTRLIGRK